MIKLDKVTLTTITSVNEHNALKALKYSMKGIEFGGIKFFSHNSFNTQGIENIKIPKIDLQEYSRFIVYELHKYIDTDYALIIQDDGFVVNPNKWQSEFLNFDYIGAPWPMPQDSFSYRDPMGNLIRVGNGGFSLRSKKLLSLATDLDLPWKSYYGYYNEDGFFTCHNRAIYEECGCRFAPLEVAKYFSHECFIPELIGIEPFGFHGRGSKYMQLLNTI